MSRYTAGNCTAFVAGLFGWVPDGLGDAHSWLANAPSHGLSVSSTPVPGSVAAFNGVSSFGHVAAVNSVDPGSGTMTVREMNFSCGLGCEDTRTVPISSADGFILPPGGMGSALGSVPFVGGLLSSVPSMFGSSSMTDVGWRGGLIASGLLLVVVGLLVFTRGQLHAQMVGSPESSSSGG